MIDLTEITDEVARKWYQDTQEGGPNVTYEHLAPSTKVAIKGALLPIISQVAELVEREVTERVEAVIVNDGQPHIAGHVWVRDDWLRAALGQA